MSCYLAKPKKLSRTLERENALRSQLDAASARDLEEVNCVRAELHESTIEVACLREELAELLDHSSMQSTTIEHLKLELAEIWGNASSWSLSATMKCFDADQWKNLRYS